MFERAIERDSNFALAHLGAARVHGFLYGFGGYDPSAARLAMAEAALERARQLDPESAELHLMLGLHYYRLREFDSALTHFDRVQQARPGLAQYYARGLVQRRQGRWDDALSSFRSAVEQDPLNWEMHYTLGQVLSAHGRFEEAIERFDEAISLNPSATLAYVNKAFVYLKWRGSTADARRVLAEAPVSMDQSLADFWWTVEVFDRSYEAALSRLTPGLGGEHFYLLTRARTHSLMGQHELAVLYYDSARVALEQGLEGVVAGSTAEGAWRSYLGQAYAGLGRKGDALAEAEMAIEILPVSRDAVSGEIVQMNVARIFSMTGELDLAVEVLESMASVPGLLAPTPHTLRLDPSWDSLRDHPRFRRLLEAGN
jgi:serine/threonine-protein kinase